MTQNPLRSGISQELDDLSTKRLLARLSPAGQRKYLDTQLAADFSAFIMKVFETVSGYEEFRPNWHIDAMAYAAQLVIDGKLDRLMVTLPPRHLKSIIFSVALPAFLLGLDPTKRIICVSYSNELAVKHANDFRAIRHRIGINAFSRLPKSVVRRIPRPRP
jgi:hypothetical protein